MWISCHFDGNIVLDENQMALVEILYAYIYIYINKQRYTQICTWFLRLLETTRCSLIEIYLVMWILFDISSIGSVMAPVHGQTSASGTTKGCSLVIYGADIYCVHPLFRVKAHKKYSPNLAQAKLSKCRLDITLFRTSKIAKYINLSCRLLHQV